MPELILVTGGARSGKSRLALRLVEPSPRRVFIATAQAFDAEMTERIRRHQEERGEGWSVREAPLALSEAILEAGAPGSGLLVDCLTVWLGNLLHQDPELHEGKPVAAPLLDALAATTADRVVLVTNEVGMGIVPMTELGRRFRDLAGRLNQQVAARADHVVFAVSGLPLLVKGGPLAELS